MSNENHFVEVGSSHPAFPKDLSVFLGGNSNQSLSILGHPGLLANSWTGLFSSSKCPGSLILLAYQLSLSMQKANIPLASGFHSPVEKDFLAVALRGSQPILVCPARSLEGMRISKEFRQPLEEGRLIFASQFPNKQKRPTQQIAYERNRLVAALSDRILIVHAEPDSLLIALCQEAMTWGKPVFTLNDPGNEHLTRMGVKPVSPESTLEEI